jgi:hypothetical protein
MMHKVLIGLTAAALVTGASTLSASAAVHGAVGGGPGMHGGGGGGPSMQGGGRRSAGPSSYGFHGSRYGYRERYEHRPYYKYGYRERYEYRPYRYGYSSGGSCWTREWTPEGWTRRWVCGSERPYYGYRYSYYRPYYEHRYGHYRPFYGHRYGRH